MTYEYSHLDEPHNVRMKQDYLRAYYVFENEKDKLIPRIKELVKDNTNDVNGLMKILSGLSFAKHD